MMTFSAREELPQSVAVLISGKMSEGISEGRKEISKRIAWNVSRAARVGRYVI